MWLSGQKVIEAQAEAKRKVRLQGKAASITTTSLIQEHIQGGDPRRRGMGISKQVDIKEAGVKARMQLRSSMDVVGGHMINALYFEDEDDMEDEREAAVGSMSARRGSKSEMLKLRSETFVKKTKGLWATGEREKVEEHERQMAERAVYLKKKLRQMNKNMGAWLRSSSGVTAAGDIKRSVYKDVRTGATLKAHEDAQPFLEEHRELMREMEQYHGKSVVNAPDFISYNARTTWQTRPGIRHVQYLRNAVERERRVDTALQRRREIEAKSWEDMHENMRTKGPLAKIQAKERAEIAERNANAARDWLHFILVRGAAQKLYERMMITKIMRFRKKAAAQRIVNFVKKFKDKMMKKIRARRRFSLAKTGVTSAGTMSETRFNPAADKVKKFLQDFAEFKKVVPAIISYKRKVLVMQRCIRAFIIRQRETNAYNESAWKGMEMKELKLLMREKRKALADDPSAPKLGRVKLGGGRGDPESLSEDSIPHLLLPIDVVRKYLHRFILGRRTKFMGEMAIYHKQLEEYRAQKEQRAMLNSRIAEFTGEEDWTTVEKMTTRLADKKLKLVPRPKRVLYTDHCTETELRELWCEAVVIHGNATIRALYEEFGAAVRRKHVATAAANAQKKGLRGGSFNQREDADELASALFAGVKDGDIKARVQMSKI